jgi:hypothetical protein
MFKFVSILLLSFSFSLKTLAWGDVGHGAVGLIAEKNLSTNAKEFIRGILGVEPLAVSANWPDQVRSDERFKEFSPYHYLELPYKYTTYEKVPLHERAERNSDTIIANARNVLLSNTFSREQKMIFLRYLVHVVGDIHMPLHVGNGLDMGANLCEAYWPNPFYSNTPSLVNLHALWDERLIDNIAFEYQQKNGPSTAKRWFGYKELTDVILNESKNVVPEEAREKNPIQWYSESRNLHRIVYPDGINVKPENRVYCKVLDPKTDEIINGSYDKNKLPTLSAVYIKRALPVIKVRIKLAGFRLAQLIEDIAKDAGKENVPNEESILSGILLKNESGRMKPKTFWIHPDPEH